MIPQIGDAHTVGTLPDGRTQLFIAPMFLHESRGAGSLKAFSFPASVLF
ncbi:MAG: hypothetical protein ACI4OS_05495 [Akkermansia sp.]